MSIRTIFISLIFLLLPVGVMTASAQSVTAPNSSQGINTSFNWAGYVARGNNFAAITGTWTIPYVTNAGIFAGDATWIGIGGVTNADLIQVGTQVISNPSGQLEYSAFYETLPQSSQSIAITVNPGDSMTASLSQQSPNEWVLSIKDNTNDQNFETTLQYASSLSSAEWIEEMPSTAENIFIPLDNFGTVQFSNASATQNNNMVTVAGAQGQIMNMLNSNGQALAVPSAIGIDGESFSVTRTAAVPTTSANQESRFSRQGHRTGIGVRSYTQVPRNYQNMRMTGHTFIFWINGNQFHTFATSTPLTSQDIQNIQTNFQREEQEMQQLFQQREALFNEQE